jgi:K+-transporting ATPase ATPase C chain
MTHLRACLWLLLLTLLLCSVAYPFLLWVVGQAGFPHQAAGSLVDEEGNPVTDPAKARGSVLIGQPFNGDEYFKPRPSSAGNGYDASASGASNLAASNPVLRNRVARQLGPMVKYAPTSPIRQGKAVGPYVEAWFKKQTAANPHYVAGWAHDNSALAEQYVKENPEAIARWLKQHQVGKWQGRSEEQNIKDARDNPGEVAKLFFTQFAAKEPRAWPAVDATNKVIQAKTEKSEDIQGYFFDLWLQDKANRSAVLEKVPADMVMASGSGLDPHITLNNALFQLERVADKWAEKPEMAGVKDSIKKAIQALLEEKASAPLGTTLIGARMVNVLEVNVALKERMKRLAKDRR